MDLLSILDDTKKHNIFVMGTATENKISDCILKPTKSISKKRKGTYGTKIYEATGISIVRWNDNSVVTTVNILITMSNFRGLQKDITEKKMENLPQPDMIYNYNKFLSLRQWCSNVKAKKWWWSVFVNTINI